MIKKNLITNKITQVESGLLSNYYLDGTLEILKKLPPDNYLLCAGYGLFKNNDFIKEMDFQIGFTGSGTSRESSYKSFTRELREELHLKIPNRLPIIKPYTIKKRIRHSTRTIDIFNININKTETNNNHGSFCKKSDWRKKIVGLVHGIYDDIMLYFETISLKDTTKDVNDNIAYIMAIKIKDLLKFIPEIQKSKKNIEISF